MPTKSLLICLLLAAVGPLACGPAEPPPDGPGKLTIGTGHADGSDGFVDMPSDGLRPLVPGAQGGFHVYINLRLDQEAIDLVGMEPTITRIGRRIDTDELVSRTIRSESFVKKEGSGHYETESSLLLFLCPTPIGISVAEERLRLKVTAENPDTGAKVSGEIEIEPHCPEDGQKRFCENICYG